MDKAKFCISIDFELIYGFIFNQNLKLHKYFNNFSCKRDYLINTLIEKLDQFEIPATWAFTGQLLDPIISIKNKHYSAILSNWLKIYPIIKYQNLYNAIDVYEKLKKSHVNHEIGIHSFYHINCNDQFYSKSVFTEEFERIYNLRKIYSEDFSTLIFPRNQKKYLNLLKKYEIKYIRDPGPLINRSLQYVYNKLKIHVGYNVFWKLFAKQPSIYRKDNLIFVPSNLCLKKKIPIQKIVNTSIFEIDKAVKNKNYFHIYFHIHDLFSEPYNSEKLDGLIQILEYINYLMKDQKIQPQVIGDFNV